MTRQRHSIRRHLLALVLAVLAPVLILAGGLTAWLVASERATYEEAVREAARDLAVAIDRDVGAVETGLRVLAASPALGADDLAGFLAQAGAVARQEGVNITLRDRDSRQVANTSVPAGAPLPTGTSLAEVDAQARRRGAPVVSPFYRGIVTGEPSFAVVVPVVRDGDARYFLSAAAGVRRLGDVVASERLRQGWGAAIVDGGGTVLTRYPWSDAAPGREAPAALVAAARTGQGLWRGPDESGTPTVVGLAPSARTGWTVAASAPVELVRADLLQALAVVAGAAALLVGLALAAAFGIARRLSEAVERLSRTAAAVLQGAPAPARPAGIAEVDAVEAALRAAGAELRQNEERLRLAQAAGRIATWEVDLATGAATRLGAWREVIGDWGDARPSHEHFLSTVHPDDRARVEAALADAIARETSYECEFRVLWPDGSERTVAERGEIVRGADGRAAVVRGVAFDVTARAKAEATLAALNADLERRVADRTQALDRESAERRRAERQLHQSQKMEAIGRLTGGLAHDLNNKLQVISAQIDTTLRRLKGEPTLSKGLLSAAVAADRCAELITKLLAFARNDEASPAVVDLAEALGSITALLDRSLLGDSVALELDVAPDLWPVEIDAAHFEAALVNLAVNARDAMPDGGSIVIAARNVRAAEARALDARLAEDCVEIRAIDTGVGIPPEHLDKVMEPFFTTKPPGKGTGLGLAQVYGFVTAAGGTLLIDSAPGEGTTVALYLPRARVDGRIGAPAPVEPIDDEDRPARRGTVLLVDDDVDVADAVRAVLAERGYRVAVATNAEEALAAVEGRAVDLVLSDVTMPGGLSGIELARAIRERRPALPVVLITGNPRALGDHNGEFPLVVKPITGRKLEEAIEREIDLRPGAQVVRLKPRAKG